MSALSAVKISPTRHYVVCEPGLLDNPPGQDINGEEFIGVAAIEMRQDGNGISGRYDVIHITDHGGEEIAIPAHNTFGWRVARSS